MSLGIPAGVWRSQGGSATPGRARACPSAEHVDTVCEANGVDGAERVGPVVGRPEPPHSELFRVPFSAAAIVASGRTRANG